MKAKNRTATIKRNTSETQITLKLNLDGTGKYKISSPIPFLNHMLESFARHGFFDLEIKAKGDVDIDDHHLVEDIGNKEDKATVVLFFVFPDVDICDFVFFLGFDLGFFPPSEVAHGNYQVTDAP